MADTKGDPDKQPPECKRRSLDCPNIRNTYEGYDGERWSCDHCGKSFYLDYEDMK